MSSTALSSWETEGRVCARLWQRGGVCGRHVRPSALPPGTPLGTGEVARTFLAAYNSTTGALITSFNPAITYSGANAHPGCTRWRCRPMAARCMSGGIFDHVNGAARTNLAAFNTATGALTSWAPSTGPRCIRSRSPQRVADLSRRRVHPRRTVWPAPLPRRWTRRGSCCRGRRRSTAPCTRLAVAPDDSQVVLGGYFQHHQRGGAELGRGGRPGQRDDQRAVGAAPRPCAPRRATRRSRTS